MSNAIEMNDDDFDSVVLKSELPVLVDFWSPTCVSCRAMIPAVEALAKALEGKALVVKVNLYDCMKTAVKLNISSLPTLLVYNKGEMAEKVTSPMSKDKIFELINKYL